MIRRIVSIAAVMGALVVAAPGSASAQGGGILVGLNSANLSFDGEGFGSVDLERRNGLVAGVYADWPMTDMFKLEVNALVAQKGAHITDPDFGDELGIDLTYLDIPVLAKVSIPTMANAGVHLYAGPSFNIKLTESFDPEEEGDEDEVETLELGFVLGGGITINRFRVDVRYGFGLNSIIDQEDLGSDATVKNKVFSVLFGFAFM